MSVQRHLSIVVLSLVAIFILYRILALFGAFTIYGYVDGNVQQIAAGVNGYVQHVYVEDNQLVRKGQLLLDIDPTPYQLKVSNLLAELQESQQKLSTLQNQLKNMRYNLDTVAEQRQLATKNLTRYQQLLTRGGISPADFDQVKLTYQSEQDAYMQAKLVLSTAEDAINMQNSTINAIQAELKLAQYNLAETRIYAPASGYVTNYKIYQGDYVSSGNILFGIIDSNSWYITADYHETDVGNINVGQTVWVHLNSSPWRLYRGTVISVSHGVARDQIKNDPSLPYVTPVMGWLNYNYYFPVRIELNDPSLNSQLFLGSSVITFVVF